MYIKLLDSGNLDSFRENETRLEIRFVFLKGWILSWASNSMTLSVSAFLVGGDSIENLTCIIFVS